jgi:hypothetical protein
VSTGTPEPTDLRLLVRELLRELLPSELLAGGAGAGAAAGGAGDHAAAGGAADRAAAAGVVTPASPAVRVPPGQPGASFTVHDNAQLVETVSLRTDQDLAAFVTRLLHLFENPARRGDLRSGRLRFRLTAPAGPGQAGPARRIEKGAVTEAAVRDAARAGARLVLGPRAVLTPLARDRARAAGVEIERERP